MEATTKQVFELTAKVTEHTGIIVLLTTQLKALQQKSLMLENKIEELEKKDGK